MKILLLGANGQIGHELRRLLVPFGELVCTTRSGVLPGGCPCVRLDLGNEQEVEQLVQMVRPHVIVNAAAYTQVDRAEQEVAAAEHLNWQLPAQLAQLALQHCALLVHYSTDYVFGGAGRTPWRESDPTGPRSVYGRTKLAGESAILRTDCASLILRTQWIYAARGRNFLLTMLKLAREGRDPAIVDDQFGAPTPAAWVAAATLVLLVRWSSRSFGTNTRGVYHLSAHGVASWLQFAEEIFRQAQVRGLLERRPRPTPTTTLAYAAPAPRPPWSVFDCAKIEAEFGIRLPAWQLGVEQVLAELADRESRSS